jgi:hypothetical protein
VFVNVTPTSATRTIPLELSSINFGTGAGNLSFNFKTQFYSIIIAVAHISVIRLTNFTSKLMLLSQAPFNVSKLTGSSPPFVSFAIPVFQLGVAIATGTWPDVFISSPAPFPRPALSSVPSSSANAGRQIGGRPGRST